MTLEVNTNKSTLEKKAKKKKEDKKKKRTSTKMLGL